MLTLVLDVNGPVQINEVNAHGNIIVNVDAQCELTLRLKSG